MGFYRKTVRGPVRILPNMLLGENGLLEPFYLLCVTWVFNYWKSGDARSGSEVIKRLFGHVKVYF